MFELLIGVVIGAFVGWQFPQPAWAKTVQEKVVALLKKE